MLKEFEQKLTQTKADSTQFLGIDEVGRGALFGPVTVAGVLIPFHYPVAAWHKEVTDSKKLGARQRIELAEKIKGQFTCKIRHVSVGQIDAHNINQAIKYGVYRLTHDLLTEEDTQCTELLLDGNYRFEFPAIRMMKGMPGITTVIGGDEHCFSIACASIIAKVARDLLISRAGQRYNHYHLESNKGYGTAEHLKAIEEHGLTRLHRRSFTKNYWPN